MAAFARGRETQRNMIDRCLRVVVIRLMTRDARSIRDLVIPVHMTLDALHRGMEARQRPTSCRVIELTIRPQHGVMAVLAGGREAGLNVIHRHFRVVVIRLVARHAGCARQVVVVVDVAQRARCGRVEAG